MTKRAFACATLTLLFGLASLASADSISASLSAVTPNRIVDISINGGHSYRSILAGAMQWNRTGGDHEGMPTGAFDSFCIELTQYVNYHNNYTFEVVPLETAPRPGGSGVGQGMMTLKADLLRELWGSHYGEATTRDSAAAFQLAVWEIVYDDGVTLNDGSFRVRPRSTTPLYVTIAQNWLDSLDGHGPKAHLVALSNPCLQDQVIAAPLPSAAFGGIALVLVMAVIKIRRNLLEP